MVQDFYLNMLNGCLRRCCLTGRCDVLMKDHGRQEHASLLPQHSMKSRFKMCKLNQDTYLYKPLRDCNYR